MKTPIEIYMTISSNNINAAKDRYEREMSRNITDVFITVGKKWQQGHPKRHLKLVTGMGCLFWTIDGEILHTNHKEYSTDNWYTINIESDLSCQWDGWKNCGISDHQKQAQFKPLLVALEWLNNVLDDNDHMDKYLDNMDFKLI